MAASTGMANSKVGGRDNRIGQISPETDNFSCPICFDLLIEPVSMPCRHVLCHRCFRQHVFETSLLCPICRLRISSWTRKATRQNCLINQQLWAVIQQKFPDIVRRKIARMNKECVEIDDSETDDEIILMSSWRPTIAMPGEVRKEYEDLMTKFKEERELEVKQSEEFIMTLKRHEQLEKEKCLKKMQEDFLMAKLLEKSINEPTKIASDCILKPNKQRSVSCDSRIISEDVELGAFERTQSCVAMPTHNVDENPQTSEELVSNRFVTYMKPEKTNEPDQDNESLSAAGTSYASAGTSHNAKVPIMRSTSLESEDSITEELRHFRPIKVAPKTPPKLLPNGRAENQPQLINATPRNLTLQWDSSNNNNNSIMATATNTKDTPSMENAAWLQKRLALLDSDRRNKVATISKNTETKKPIPRTAIASIQRKQHHMAMPSTTFILPKVSSSVNCDEKSVQTVDKENPTSDADVTKKRKNQMDINNIGNSNESFHCGRQKKSKSVIDHDPPDVDPRLVDINRLVENDRLVALKLHRELQLELIKNPYAIDRRKGAPDEYNLRSRRRVILS